MKGRHRDNKIKIKHKLNVFQQFQNKCVFLQQFVFVFKNKSVSRPEWENFVLFVLSALCEHNVLKINGIHCLMFIQSGGWCVHFVFAY